MVGAILLFDISWFFDHLDPSLTICTLLHLGVDQTTCNWVHSFMTNHSIFLSFNDYSSSLFSPKIGTPQGSPLSPILSALFTAPLLHHAAWWEHEDLSLYIDDGTIYSSGPTYAAAASHLTHAVSEVFTWLHSFGLVPDTNKMELMFFHPLGCHSPHKGTPPSLSIPLPHTLPLVVRPTPILQYLRVFFMPTLNWDTHTKTLANHACSTIVSLGVLGNSVRGFSLTQWRTLFHSLILPILTYRFQVWFTDVNQASLLCSLQVAQNDAYRKMSGIFHTTPIHMTEKLLSIPLICYHLHHLIQAIASHLTRLPPSCALCNLHLTCKSTCIPHFHIQPPLFPSCAEVLAFFPPFSLPPHPMLHTWTPPHITFLSLLPYSKMTAK